MKKFTPKEQRIAARVLRQLISDTRRDNVEQDYLLDYECCICKTPDGYVVRGGKKCTCEKPEKAVVSLFRLVEKNSNLIIKTVQPVRVRKPQSSDWSVKLVNDIIAAAKAKHGGGK